MNFDDPTYRRDYDEVPHGLVRHIVRKSNGNKASAERFRRASRKAWSIVASRHGTRGLPNRLKYGTDTWEWTVGREFYDHLIERAAHLLDIAVKADGSERGNGDTGRGSEAVQPLLRSLAEAAAWLELASANDEEGKEGSRPAIKKNLGLAYMHMVRNKEHGVNISLPKLVAVFSDAGMSELIKPVREIWWNDDGKEGDWKTWASLRWSEAWKEFLELDGENEPTTCSVVN